MMVNKGFEPDLLLGAFASGLFMKRLTPVQVKAILEEEGYFERGKMTIEEFEPILRNELPEILHRFDQSTGLTLRDTVGPTPNQVEPNSTPPDDQRSHRVQALDHMYNWLMSFAMSPHAEKARLEMTLKGEAQFITTWIRKSPKN
jgi:hypothetical protein